MRIGLTDRIRRVVAVLFSVILSVALILFAIFVFDVKKVENLPSNLVCEDMVVLTGGKNRIKLALDSVKKFHAKNVLISGVYKGTKLEDILGDAKDVGADSLGDVTIILGYKAMNTEGNAKEIREVAKDLGMKEIVLVTSDYHMFRSLHEVRKYNKNLKIYPMKVQSDFNFRFISLCFREFYRSLGVLIKDSIAGVIKE
ncbi:MAG: YdcF family protein [Alphaproteobacteria bacterium]|nr:YdcF family protein [Alphaproteobacteria bacterium]